MHRLLFAHGIHHSDEACHLDTAIQKNEFSIEIYILELKVVLGRVTVHTKEAFIEVNQRLGTSFDC